VKARAFLLLFALASPALASDSLTCRDFGLTSGLDYRECRLLLGQLASGDPYVAAMAKARLLQLQMHRFNRERAAREDEADFSRFGLPQEPLGGPGDCMTFGPPDAAITRCR